MERWVMEMKGGGGRERGREGSACLENSGRGKVGGTGGASDGKLGGNYQLKL